MKYEKIFWGLLFILIAIFVVINPLNCLADISIIEILLGIMFGCWCIKSIMHLNFAGFLFSLAFICIIFNEELGISDLTPWPVLIAAAFGSMGLHCIFPHASCKCKCFKHRDNFNTSTSSDSEDTVSIDTSFNESIKYVTSKNFKNAEIDCSFGGVKLYLDNAKISPEGATINLDASFSGVELYIPKDVEVINKLYNSLSGVEEKGKKSNSDVISGQITLTGSISFSGVSIYYI